MRCWSDVDLLIRRYTAGGRPLLHLVEAVADLAEWHALGQVMDSDPESLLDEPGQEARIT